MRWRKREWPEEHYSKLSLELSPFEGGTRLSLSQTGVPGYDLENTTNGWRLNFFAALKQTYGYGGRMFWLSSQSANVHYPYISCWLASTHPSVHVHHACRQDNYLFPGAVLCLIALSHCYLQVTVHFVPPSFLCFLVLTLAYILGCTACEGRSIYGVSYSLSNVQHSWKVYIWVPSWGAISIAFPTLGFKLQTPPMCR